MAMTRMTVRVGQKPTSEQIEALREAAQYPIVYDPECPPSDAEALAEFAAQARALRAKHKEHPSVTLRIPPDCLEIYKSLGRGYTDVMADVLAYAATHPEFLRQVHA